MTDESISTIARGLSEAERPLFTLDTGGEFQIALLFAMAAGWQHGADFAYFANKHPDLIESKYSPAGQVKVYRLTPLGLAVRAHLQQVPAGEGS